MFIVTGDGAGAVGRVHVQALMEPDGRGKLFATDGPGPWRWESCFPGLRQCAPIGGGREIGALGEPPGRVFRVKSGAGTAASPEWLGPLHDLLPPTVSGEVRADGFVSPVAGTWGGGWKGERSQMQLSACLDPSGGSCVTLTDPHFVRPCTASASVGIEARFVGYYLRVAERRPGAPPLIETPDAVSSPFGAEAWAQAPDTAVNLVGKIEPPTRPWSGECGPATPPTAAISSLGVARIECQGGCQATLLAEKGARRTEIAKTLPEENALYPASPSQLRISRSAFSRLGPGAVRLTIEIDGTVSARRTIKSPVG